MQRPRQAVCLYPFVVQLCAAAHDGAVEGELGDFPICIHVHIPHHCRPILIRQQRGRALGQLRWVQAYRVIRQVHGLPAADGFCFQLGTRLDHCPHVGDGITHVPSTGTGSVTTRTTRTTNSSLNMHRLIQVHGARRINGHEFHVTGIPPLLRVSILGGGSLLMQLRRKSFWQLEFACDGAEI